MRRGTEERGTEDSRGEEGQRRWAEEVRRGTEERSAENWRGEEGQRRWAEEAWRGTEERSAENSRGEEGQRWECSRDDCKSNRDDGKSNRDLESAWGTERGRWQERRFQPITKRRWKDESRKAKGWGPCKVHALLQEHQASISYFPTMQMPVVTQFCFPCASLHLT